MFFSALNLLQTLFPEALWSVAAWRGVAQVAFVASALGLSGVLSALLLDLLGERRR